MKQITKKEIEEVMSNMTFNLSDVSFNAFIADCALAFDDASKFNGNLEYNDLAEFQNEMSKALIKLIIDKEIY